MKFSMVFLKNGTLLFRVEKKKKVKTKVGEKAVIFVVMASSSTFSSWTFNGSTVAPKTTKHCSKFVCNCLNCFFNQTISSISSCASHDMISPNWKGVDWARGRLSLKSRAQCRALDVGITSSYSGGNKFQLEDVIEAQQFDRDTLGAIFEVALEMEKIEKNSTGSQILKGYLMATLFYEPSTRTRLSFESAMKRLGGEVLTTENAREFSSAAKGETLEDTIRTVEGYSDIIVMRHFESGAARRAAATASIPIINAGDGPGQHPTQDDIKDYLTSKGVEWEESADLMEVASKCDVIYQTRIQRERFGERIDLYEEARGKYIVDCDVLRVMQKHAVVMHPLPRLDEITADVDGDPRAAYFRQAKNGLYIRMALLKLLLIGW